MTDTPTQSPGPTKSKFWETIGKLSVVVAIVTAIITAVINLYDFKYRKEPFLVARIEVSHASHLPLNLISELSDQVNIRHGEHFLLSLGKEEKFVDAKNNNPLLLEKLTEYFLEAENVERQAFRNLVEITQAIRVYIQNKGERQAESVQIDLPIGSKGYFRIDALEEKPFEQKIDLGNIRADKTIAVDIWLRRETIEAKDVVVSYPDGLVPVEKPAPVESWFDFLMLPTLVLETVIILILLIALNKRFPKEVQNTEKSEGVN